MAARVAHGRVVRPTHLVTGGSHSPEGAAFRLFVFWLCGKELLALTTDLCDTHTAWMRRQKPAVQVAVTALSCLALIDHFLTRRFL